MLQRTHIRTQDIAPGDHIIDPDGGFIAEIVKVISITEETVTFLRQEEGDEPMQATYPTGIRTIVNRDPAVYRAYLASQQKPKATRAEQPKPAVKKVYTEAEIREKLESDWQWQRRALLRLFTLQTADEQATDQTRHDNNVGFTAAHAKKLTSFARQLRNGKQTLSHKQMHYVTKWLPCYAGQLHRITYGSR